MSHITNWRNERIKFMLNVSQMTFNENESDVNDIHGQLIHSSNELTQWL